MTRLPLPCLAVDDLSALPFSQRFRAYADYDAASNAWHLARYCRRNNIWGWRLEARRAIRMWRYYKEAVHAAQSMRAAA